MKPLLFFVATGLAFGQTPSIDSQTLKALLEEVHKLRLALEKSNVVVPQAQLTMQMLSLQEQRVVRTEQQLEAVTKQIAGVNEERRHFTEELERTAQRLTVATDPNERRDLESRQAAMRKLVADQTSLVELRGREGTLMATLQQERAALADLTARFKTLERSLAQ